MSWAAAPQNETFDEAMSLHPGGHSQEAWYVALIVQEVLSYDLDADEFQFDGRNPGPQIMSCFTRKLSPHDAALELFAVRH